MDKDRDRILRAYYSCFNDEAGKIVLKDLRNKFFESSLVVNPINKTEIILSVGCRETVLYILACIEEYEMKQR